MKIIIIVGVLIGCIYFWSGRSNNSIPANECASLGGKLTEHGCETPMTKEECESLHGTLVSGECELKRN